MHYKNLSLHEAIVIALINQPARTAAYIQIVKTIRERDLLEWNGDDEHLLEKVKKVCVSRDAPYVSLFEELGPEHLMLKDAYAMQPIIMSEALDSILNHHQYFYNPFSPKLRVFDEASEYWIEKSINPEKIICIVTQELPGWQERKKSGRKKFIYYLGTDLRGEAEINIYHINESMEKLKLEIDSLNSYLAVVSNNVIVNVGYYKQSNTKELSCVLNYDKLSGVKTVNFSDSPKAKENLEKFQLVQSYYEMRTWLQKAILKYKDENELPLTGKFGV